MKWIIEGGLTVMVQLLITVAVLAIIIRQMALVARKNQSGISKIKNQNDLIIYGGVLNLVIGLIGQLMDLFNALGAIMVATEINPKIVAEGFRIAAIPTIYGFWSLIILSIFWIVFRLKTRILDV